ncbi:MAG: hypothetical protein RL205_1736 [Actinomycetota bacterium]
MLMSRGPTLKRGVPLVLALVAFLMTAAPTSEAASIEPSDGVMRQALLSQARMASITGFTGRLYPDGEALNGCEDLPQGFWCARSITTSQRARVSPSSVTIAVYPTLKAARSSFRQQWEATQNQFGETLLASSPTRVVTRFLADELRDAQGALVSPATVSVTESRLVGRLVVTGTCTAAVSARAQATLAACARALSLAQSLQAPRTQ